MKACKPPVSEISMITQKQACFWYILALLTVWHALVCLFVFISGTMRFSRYGLGASATHVCFATRGLFVVCARLTGQGEVLNVYFYLTRVRSIFNFQNFRTGKAEKPCCSRCVVVVLLCDPGRVTALPPSVQQARSCTLQTGTAAISLFTTHR
jgi:hypothetical protein